MKSVWNRVLKVDLSRGYSPVDQYERRFRFANIQIGKKSFLGRCGLGAGNDSVSSGGLLKGRRTFTIDIALPLP